MPKYYALKLIKLSVVASMYPKSPPWRHAKCPTIKLASLTNLTNVHMTLDVNHYSR